MSSGRAIGSHWQQLKALRSNWGQSRSKKLAFFEALENSLQAVETRSLFLD